MKTGHATGSGFSANQSAPGVNRVSANSSSVARGRPLVVIRFDRANVDYQSTLYSVINRALEREPNAAFDLVAVTPAKNAGQAGATTQARRNAEGVLRSLTGMGLPASRINLSATSSGDTQSNEVQIYVR